MEQDEYFNFDSELLHADQDNELFYNFGDFEESQDLEDVNVVLIITCIYLISFKTLRISDSSNIYSYKK